MKKTISVLLIFSLALSTMFSMAPFVFAEFTPDEATIDRVFGLGLMPHVSKSSYSPDADVTRGELALILENIENYKARTDKADFTWQFYGNSYIEVNELKSVPEGAKQRFEDVPITHWAFNTIENVCGYGYMNGVSSSSFAPDGTLTVEQLAKTFVVLLGYESLANYYGGYPSGYMKVARDLKLLSGVPASGNVTNSVIMQMLDNMLDVRLMEFDGIVTKDNVESVVYTGSDDTFLTGILGLGRVEGLMTDNSVTSLTGASRVPQGQFVIDGTKFKAFEDISSTLYKLIGRQTEAYYVAGDSKNFGYIVYAALTGENNATVIEANDFAGYNNGTITYFDGDKSKSLKLTSFYNLIYNGKVKTSFDKSIFDFEDGTITVIESDGTDVVLIEDYETWYLSGVDYENSKIFNRIGAKLTDSTIDFDDYDFISIIKQDGTPGTIEDITADMVISVCKNGNYVSVELCTDVVSGTIDSVVNSDGSDYYVVGDGEYKFSAAYNSYKDKNLMKIGSEVTLYLNKYGKIAWVNDGAYGTYKVGYVMNFDNSSNGFDNKTAFMIFDTTEKKANTYYAPAEKLKVSNSLGEEVSYTDYAKFAKDHGAYRGIVRYTLTDAGEINYIEYPITDLTNAMDNKLTLLFSLNGNIEKDFANLGGGAIFNSSSVVINMDSNKETDEDSYEIKTATSVFTNEQTNYKALCYTTKKNSKLAEYIVRDTPSKSAAIEFTHTSRVYMAVVKKVVQTYDEDAGAVDTIRAMGFTNQYVDTPADIDLKLDKNVTIRTIMNKEDDFSHPLEPGDIIAYGTNLDGYVTEIRVIWDESEKNPASPDGISGMLTDSKGYFDAEDFSGDNFVGTKGLPNPYTLFTDGTKDTVRNASTFTTSPFSIYYGFSPRVMDGAIELTTQDLTTEEFDPYGAGGKYITRVYKLPANAVFVNLSGKSDIQVTYTSTTSMMDQIRTQDMYKSGCSRIFTQTNGGELTRLIVINGQFE